MVSKILFLLLNELEVIRQLILVLKFFSVRTVSSLKDAMCLSDFSFTPSNYCCLLSTGSIFLSFKPSVYYSGYTFHCVLDTTLKQSWIMRLSRHEKYIDQSLTALFSQCYFCSEMLQNRTLPVYFSRFEVTVEFGKGRSLSSICYDVDKFQRVAYSQFSIYRYISDLITI